MEINENDLNQEEIATAADAIEAFFTQFGKIDIYTQITLEEFLQALLNEK